MGYSTSRPYAQKDKFEASMANYLISTYGFDQAWPERSDTYGTWGLVQGEWRHLPIDPVREAYRMMFREFWCGERIRKFVNFTY